MASMRPRTRDAVSLFVIHNGSMTRITSAVVIARTGKAPRTGLA
jgi:hypothetical protein